MASCFSAACDFHHFPQSIAHAVLFTYRYFAFVLAGCLALPCLVLWRFPKPDKQPARNIAAHLWMLVSYFCVYGLSYLAINITGVQETTITIVNTIMMFALCGLYASWAFVLTARGEVSSPWPKLGPELVALIDARNDAAVQRGERFRRSRG
jgi:amino acid transporter